MDKMARPAALITGGGTRLGLAFAKALASTGHDIALHYHRSVGAAESAVKEIEALGVTCITFQADLAAAAPEKLINRAVDKFPNLCVLINSASAYEAATIADTNMALLQQQFTVNFFAPFLLTQAFASMFSAKSSSKGAIINILDNKIAFQQNDYAAYLLSKKALMEFTLLSAMEYAPQVRINGIAPGVIMPGVERTEDYVAWRIKGIPLKWQGDMGNLLSAMNYLLSNEFVTGQILTVDGGEGLNYQGLNAVQFNDRDHL
jgi:NAD(P)-dependent dehydrogenase (short-subunit alcohol dehydrogenase family)